MPAFAVDALVTEIVVKDELAVAEQTALCITALILVSSEIFNTVHEVVVFVIGSQ
jgi:hypothetical protein